MTWVFVEWYLKKGNEEAVSNKNGNKGGRDGSIKMLSPTRLLFTVLLHRSSQVIPPPELSLSHQHSPSLSQLLSLLPSLRVDGVALSVFLSLARSLVEPHTRIRGLVWVSAQREKPERDKKKILWERIASLLWISDLIYPLTGSTSQLRRAEALLSLHLAGGGLYILDLHTRGAMWTAPLHTLHTAQVPPLTALSAGEHNQDIFSFLEPPLSGLAWKDSTVSAHPSRRDSSEGNWLGCECPLVWRPASSAPAPWITCLGL